MEEGNLFEGPREGVETLESTYEEIKKDSWNDIELS